MPSWGEASTPTASSNPASPAARDVSGGRFSQIFPDQAARAGQMPLANPAVTARNRIHIVCCVGTLSIWSAIDRVLVTPTTRHPTARSTRSKQRRHGSGSGGDSRGPRQPCCGTFGPTSRKREAVWLVVDLVGSSYLHLARTHGISGTVQRRTTNPDSQPRQAQRTQRTQRTQTTQTTQPWRVWLARGRRRLRQTEAGDSRTAGFPACNLHREMSAPACPEDHPRR